MATEFIQIFTEMGFVSALFLTIGIILCIVEIFVPGLGFLGYTGAGCVIGGIVFRTIEGLSFYQFLVLILLIAGLIFFAIGLLIFLIKTGLMVDVGVFSTKTALPKDYKNKEYKKLVGKIGKSTTPLMQAGQVKVRGKIYDAICDEGYIEKNKFIKVIRLEDNRLIVRRFWR